VSLHRAIRVAAFLALAAGLGFAYHRFHRTDEQQALTRLVQEELPKISGPENEINARIERLGQAPGLKPEEARSLLVQDVVPRLLRLRKQVAELPRPTPETRALLDEYLRVTDELVDACRTCVRIIDDPKLSTGDGLAQVRKRFSAVHAAYRAWDLHLAEACARHKLAAPPVH
jgi:hypothetical protein